MTFLSTVSHRFCDILYFLKLKGRHMNLYSFNLFIQGFMKQFESEMLKSLLLLFLKSNLCHVRSISSCDQFPWASIWMLKEKGNENFMNLMLSRNVEALCQYIYLSLGIIIINQYHYKDNGFTKAFLSQCVFYHICIFWILFPNLITSVCPNFWHSILNRI